MSAPVRPGLHRLVCVVLLALILSACAAQPVVPRKDVVTVQFVIRASERVNPDVNDRPSPIVVSVLGLRKRSAFTTADYFSLAAVRDGTASRDLVFKDSFPLLPGQTLKKVYAFAPDEVAFGVIAGFRQLGDSEWRRYANLPQGRADSLVEKLVPKVLQPGDPVLRYEVEVGEAGLKLHLPRKP